MPRLGIVNIPNHYVADWSQGHGREWAEVTPNGGEVMYTAYPPVGTFVNGEWVARYTQSSVFGKICTMPRFVLSTKRSFTVEVPVTLNAEPKQPPTVGDLSSDTYYYGVVLYNGEASYFGVYFRMHRWRDDHPYTEVAGRAAGDVYVHNYGYNVIESSPSGAFIPVRMLYEDSNGFTTGWWDVGDKLYAKIVCDAEANNGIGETRLYIRNDTRNPGGEYEHIWTRYHEYFTIEDVDPRVPHLLGSGSFDWLEPVSLWITGWPISNTKVYPGWNVDIHPITIDQDGPEVILAGAGGHYPWSGYDNDTPTGFNSWDIHPWNHYGTPSEMGCILFGELEGARYPAGLVAACYEEWIEGEGIGYMHLPMGTATHNSPVISAQGGAFGKLRLYGRNSLGGDVLQVRLLNPSTLQPITVQGQTVFEPNSGHLAALEIDLSDVQETEFILSTTLSQQAADYEWATSGYNYIDVTPILYGFVVTGTPPPEATPGTGTYAEAQTVTISNIDGLIVLYTLDGSDPRDYIVTDGGLAVFDEGELVTTGDVQ